MAKIPLKYVENREHLKALMPYWNKRSGIDEPRFEIDIAAVPRDILLLAGQYLDEDAWIKFKRIETTEKPQNSDTIQWLSYYADVLRFQDLDDFAQEPKTRKLWFAHATNFLDTIKNGQLNLNSKRENEENWLKLVDTAEDAANKKDAPPKGFASVLLLLGNEWKNKEGKLIQLVICGLPALLNLKTGELAPSKESFLINPKHLSSEDRDARKPRVGPLVFTHDDLSQSANQATNEHHDTENETPSITWPQHWDNLNNTFKNFQDSKPSLSITEFSWSGGFGNSKPNSLIFLGVVAYTAIPPANRRLIALTEDLKEVELTPPLLERILEADAKFDHSKPSVNWFSDHLNQARSRHIGHMGEQFGLDQTQRIALWQTTVAERGEIIAVSGPPGTGKTSMLQGVIATLVVQSALNERPLVTIAASQTNQATTNMIKAFRDIAKPYIEGEAVRVEHRWLDGFPSYGWYFPSASKRGDKNTPYQELYRDRMYAPTLTGAGKAASENGTPRMVSILTKEEMQSHLSTFNRRFRAYIETNNINTNLTATSYLSNRLVELVGPASILISALRNADSLYEILCHHTWQELTEAKAQHDKLTARKLPQDRSSKIRTLQSQQQETIKLIERIKKTIIDAHRPKPAGFWNKTKAFLEELLTSKRRFQAEKDERDYRALKRALLDANPSLILPDNLSMLPVFASEAVNYLCEKANEQNKSIARCERWQVSRGKLESEIQKRIETLLPIVKQQRALNRNITAIGTLFLHHRGAAANIAFRNGIQRKDTVESGIEASICGLGKEMRESITNADPMNHSTLLKVRHNIECVIDLTVRYEAFHVAMRYWEAQWIREATTPLPEDPKEETRIALERAAMLSPVIVATTQTMPSIALYLDLNRMPQHHLEIADWLLVDESGQVSPQLAVPLTCLARKALVVGDVKQLEPVVTLDRKSNMDLRRRHDLSTKTTQHQRENLDAEVGNFMACAQYSAARHEDRDNERYGVMLKYHYRCRKTIIEFCNRLVYDAIDPLIPMVKDHPHVARSPKEAKNHEALLPPMGFVAVEGKQFASDESQMNQEEISSIVSWIVENREAIKDRYGSVEKVVAVISPYGAQVRKLKEALSSVGFRVRDNESTGSNDDLLEQDKVEEMIVGTVHSLQGAEKEIVLFSTVNDLTGKIFINRKASMLNVAVSRAKHAFVVFGHPWVILKPNGQFSGILARYLIDYGYRLYPRDLYVFESPSKTKLAEQAFGKIAKGIATRGHLREFDFFENGEPKWINKDNCESFLSSMRSLTELGARHYDSIYLATDDDREGEGIAWHVMDLASQVKLAIPKERFFRLRFYAMTPESLIEGKKFTTRGVDPLRVKAALARTIADKFISIEIKAIANVGAGRVSASLLDEIDRIELQRDGARFTENIEIQPEGCQFTVKMTRLAQDDPLGATEFYSAPPENQKLLSACTRAQIIRVGPLLRSEDPAPATSTATVLHRAINDLSISPIEAMNALQEIYIGSTESEQTLEENI